MKSLQYVSFLTIIVLAKLRHSKIYFKKGALYILYWLGVEVALLPGADPPLHSEFFIILLIFKYH